MINWSTETFISFDPCKSKPEHYNSTRQRANERQLNIYWKIKEVMTCPDLNHIETIWAQIKQFIAKQNQNSSMKKIAKSSNKKVHSMGESGWEAFCANVEKVDVKVWKNKD